MKSRLPWYVCAIALWIIPLCNTSYTYAQEPEIEKKQRELSAAKTDSARIFINYQLGHYLQVAGQSDKAKKHHKDGIELSSKMHNKKWEGVGYYFLGNVYFNQSQYDSSYYYSKKAIEAFDKSGQRSIYYTYALNTIAAYYMKQGDNANALKYAQQQLDVATAYKDTNAIANSYTLFCAIADVMNDRQNSIYYSEKALEIKRKSGDKLNLAVILNNLAQLYIHTGNEKRALPLLLESAELSDKQGIPRDRGRTYLNIANCYSTLGRPDSAYYYLHLAKPIVIHADDPQFSIALYDIESMVHQDAKNYQAALIAVDSSIMLGTAADLKPSVCRSYLRKTEILAEAGNYKEALQTYGIYHALNDTIAGLATKQTMAELEEQYQLGQKNKEILFLDSTNKLNNQRLVQQQQLYTLLRSETILKDQKLKNERLLKQLLEAKLVEDSILKGALSRENTLKQTQLAQATQLNTALGKENTLKQKNLKNQRNILVLLVAGLALVILSASLLYWLYNKQKKANKTIVSQSGKLTLLMKELHHRVKNNLQIVSSLLSLQAMRMRDETAMIALKEGQYRIEAMSLIHQRLYTKDDITEVNIRDFITDLAESLMNAYGYHADNFSLVLEIENEMMNVDKAIPLGLILNEIISNAFKYAYKDVSNPELRICLKKTNEHLELLIADNGKGIDEQAWAQNEGSFGKDLIQTFTTQLNGCLSLLVNKGTQFSITFPYTIAVPD